MVRAFLVMVRRAGWIEAIRLSGMFIEEIGRWMQSGNANRVTYWTATMQPVGTVFLQDGGMFRVEDGCIRVILSRDPKHTHRNGANCIVVTPKLAAMLLFAQWRVLGPAGTRWWYTERAAR